MPIAIAAMTIWAVSMSSGLPEPYRASKSAVRVFGDVRLARSSQSFGEDDSQ